MTLANFGLYGLGTMGSALSLNIAEQGVALNVSSYVAERSQEFVAQAGPLAEKFTPFRTLAEMVQNMAAPRAIILMVPAGQAVDDSIAEARSYLQAGDVIIDAGNSDFHDTRKRTQMLEADGLAFLGMGVSGGEDGARTGPAMMVGGTETVWQSVRPVLEAIAAKFGTTPCVDRVGPDGAGHFVKTVHNGIEYADMQMIAETYGLMRNGLGQNTDEIANHFDTWNNGVLKSYLIEISAKVLSAKDKTTGKPMVDVIVDSAGQKGTGRWTVIEALKLGASVSTTESAVMARVCSAARSDRRVGEQLFATERTPVPIEPNQLEQALFAARIISYSQGFGLLSNASAKFDWSLDLAACAKIWRAGCIIRSSLLDEITEALSANPPQGILAFAPTMVAHLKAVIPSLRAVVSAAVSGGHPVPALAAALVWFDTMTQARGTADLIQGQRDLFGRHGFDRSDGGTGCHADWDE